jgi:hypothetical protein
MHHTSLDGRCLLAEAKNAAAPENKQHGFKGGTDAPTKRRTLSDPDVRMV